VRMSVKRRNSSGVASVGRRSTGRVDRREAKQASRISSGRSHGVEDRLIKERSVGKSDSSCGRSVSDRGCLTVTGGERGSATRRRSLLMRPGRSTSAGKTDRTALCVVGEPQRRRVARNCDDARETSASVELRWSTAEIWQPVDNRIAWFAKGDREKGKWSSVGKPMAEETDSYNTPDFAVARAHPGWCPCRRRWFVGSVLQRPGRSTGGGESRDICWK
jgi:hypothetical protein